MDRGAPRPATLLLWESSNLVSVILNRRGR